MRFLLAFACGLFAAAVLLAQNADWKEATLVDAHTINELCSRCPDPKRRFYLFRLSDGVMYLGETHKELILTVNGHTRIRVEHDGKIGDTLHILDASNEDQKLKIVEKTAALSDDAERVYLPGYDGVTSPRCFYMPNPPYSQEAKAAKFQGIVSVEAIIRTDGTISDPQILASPGLGLNESVLKALKQWRCNPALREEKPVSAQVKFEIHFQLTQH